MAIVRFALRFPHTFYVVAALILFLGIAAIRSMPTDIFPEIQIPVVTVIWQYTGLTTPEMEQRVTTYSQYSISSNVNGIKNMEAQTLDGLSIQKIYFQPDVNLDLAIAQIVSATNSIRALMPPGIQPPIIVQFNASSVPVLQLSLNSDKPERAAALRLRYLPRAAATGSCSRRHAADAGGRQISSDHGRHRPRQAVVPGTDAARHRECRQYAEPDAAIGNGEDRRYPVYGAHQRDPGDDRRPQHDAGQVRQRRHHLPEGRGAGPRRIDGAAERRARGWPPLGPAQRDQERQCFHPGRRQWREAGIADDPGRSAGRNSTSTRCSTNRYSLPAPSMAYCAKARSRLASPR